MITPTGFEYGPEHTVAIVVASVAVYAYYGVTAGRIFARAGVAPWQAWVPFLNSWRFLQLGGRAGWWLVVGAIPLIGTIVYAIQYWLAQDRIASAFGRSRLLLLLAIFASPVWFGVVAWGRGVWNPAHASLVPASAALR